MKAFPFILLGLLTLQHAHAQYAVNDAIAQALISQGNNNFLQQMATELSKLDVQITALQSIQSQGQQLLTVTGNPSQALSFASGSMGLSPTVLAGGSLFQTMASIGASVNGNRSLGYTGNGIFQLIPNATTDGIPIVRNIAAYNKYDAYEQEASYFQNILQNAQQQRQALLTQLQTVMNTSTSTQAEQSEKAARISALSAQLNANDQAIRDASEQRQAQHESNAQDEAKQRQAAQEDLNTEFNQAQTQADPQADAALSGILGQTP